MNAREFGFPPIGKTSRIKTGRFVAWIPGMRVDMADWYLILWHGSNMRNYLRVGGDPKKIIVHCLSFDEGIINPFWRKESFRKRIGIMREEWGCTKIIAPDFSSWAGWPVVVQLYNYYRSCVVASDFVKAGIDVIPNICWSQEICDEASLSMWEGDRPFALIDANHWSKRKSDKLLYRRGLDKLVVMFPDTHFLVWTNSKWAATLAMHVLPHAQVMGTRATSLSLLSKIST